jgi:hypothetical protein
LPRAHRVVVPSRLLARIATDLWRLPPERVRLIPNGIHLDAYRPADGHPELRRRLGIPEDAFLGAPAAIYAELYQKGGLTVTLDPEVAKMFPSAAEVNAALRSLARIIRAQQRRSAKRVQHS